MKNDFLLQFQADLAGLPVVRPKNVEMSALGAAQLAGLQAGFWNARELERMRQVDRIFRPRWDRRRREAAMAGWRAAVQRAL